MAKQDKVVQISAVDQTTLAPTGSWLTYPSPSGSLELSMSEADNTIFSQPGQIGAFESSIPTIASHTVSMSAYLRETAGYNADLKRGGTPTIFTGEAMSVESGTTYAITDVTKNYWNPRAAVTVYDGAVVVDPSNYSIDHLFGRVTFVASYTVVGAITADGEYVSLTAFGSANTIDLTQSAATNDITTFTSAQANNGWTSMEPALQTADAELSGFYDLSEDFFQVMSDRDEILVEIDWTGNGDFRSRGIFRVVSVSGSGDVGAPEEESVSLTLSSIEGVIPYSFKFAAGANEASTAFQLTANAWLNREYVAYRYAPEGLTERYFQGVACVSDSSVSVSVDGITELTVELTGTGELVSTVPAP